MFSLHGCAVMLLSPVHRVSIHPEDTTTRTDPWNTDLRFQNSHTQSRCRLSPRLALPTNAGSMQRSVDFLMKCVTLCLLLGVVRMSTASFSGMRLTYECHPYLSHRIKLVDAVIRYLFKKNPLVWSITFCHTVGLS